MKKYKIRKKFPPYNSVKGIWNRFKKTLAALVSLHGVMEYMKKYKMRKKFPPYNSVKGIWNRFKKEYKWSQILTLSNWKIIQVYHFEENMYWSMHLQKPLHFSLSVKLQRNGSSFSGELLRGLPFWDWLILPL